MALERLQAWLDNFNETITTPKNKKDTPRTLTSDDIKSFDVAAKPPKNKKQLQDDLFKCNPLRVNRMRRDFKWAQKRLKKQGVNPEEVRWLI